MQLAFDCPQCGTTILGKVTGLQHRTVTCQHCNTPVQMPDDLRLGPGAVIGEKYTIERRLGASSIGEYFLARGEDRYVRIEVLSGETSQDEEAVQRLMQEIELMASMSHPGVVEAIEAGEDTGTYFLVTAFEPGETLAECLRERSPLPEETALRFALSIAEVLKYAWEEKRVLHRDVKPENIFVTEDLEAKLTGFGIAKSSNTQSLGLTGVGFTIGTPEYMSPEQIKADENIDFRSDLYGLGCVLYECLTGELPFSDPSPIVLMGKHMDEDPEPVNQRNPEVSERSSSLVGKMLAKSPDDRHGSWQELIDELRACLSQVAPAEAPAAPPRQTAGEATVMEPRQAGVADATGGKLGLLIGIGIVVVVVLLVAVLLAIAFLGR